MPKSYFLPPSFSSFIFLSAEMLLNLKIPPTFRCSSSPRKGSQGTDWILAGGGPRDASAGGGVGRGGRSGESAGHSLGGGGTLDLGGLKDRGPQEETFTGEMGLGLLWAWSWVGKSCAAWASPTKPPVGLTRLGWGWMEASLPWSGSPRAQWSSWKEPQGRLLPRPAQEALHTGTGRRVLEW